MRRRRRVERVARATSLRQPPGAPTGRSCARTSSPSSTLRSSDWVFTLALLGRWLDAIVSTCVILTQRRGQRRAGGARETDARPDRAADTPAGDAHPLWTGARGATGRDRDRRHAQGRAGRPDRGRRQGRRRWAHVGGRVAADRRIESDREESGRPRLFGQLLRQRLGILRDREGGDAEPGEPDHRWRARLPPGADAAARTDQPGHPHRAADRRLLRAADGR